MKKLSLNQWVAVAVAIAIIAWFFASSSISSFFGSTGKNSDMNNNENMMSNENEMGPVLSLPGIGIQDTLVGSGAVAVAGKTITAHYTGTLQGGDVFDTSIGRAPFTFVLGNGSVIAGWDKGIVGMKVGGKRRLIISPEMGYGDRAIPGPGGVDLIPANSLLIFDVELLDVK